MVRIYLRRQCAAAVPGLQVLHERLRGLVLSNQTEAISSTKALSFPPSATWHERSCSLSHAAFVEGGANDVSKHSGGWSQSTHALLGTHRTYSPAAVPTGLPARDAMASPSHSQATHVLRDRRQTTACPRFRLGRPASLRCIAVKPAVHEERTAESGAHGQEGQRESSSLFEATKDLRQLA
ncbi:hypothetical protein HPB51_021952 [Rhipicephalus microplus]|uniref:Uncharacterized protein n=1 Tax=Rhipicephalus microplus TaxID=6941 RepID=A0A9J6EIY6_RHIMP|nr:hypothetical protein HPB51_021952 [Rhipicephalus microplus]